MSDFLSLEDIGMILGLISMIFALAIILVVGLIKYDSAIKEDFENEAKNGEVQKLREKE